MHNINKWLLVPYLLWMVIFIIIPAILLVYFSFIDIHGHFSFTNYEQVFSTRYLKMFIDSIWYAALITMITLIISYPAAYFISYSRFQNILLMLLIIPTWINLLLKTYAFIGLLGHDGVINQALHIFQIPKLNLLFTSGAFLLVASYIYIPFMILPIFNSMKAIPNNILQASNDLGASTFTTFRKVIVPLTREGIKTGVQVTLIPALSLFMITRLIAGNKVINVGTAIEEQFLTIQNYGLGSTIALFLIIFMAFLLIITKSKSSNGKG